MVPGPFRIRSTTFRVECVIDPTEIEDILNGHSHTHSVAVLRLNQLVNLLAARRRNNGGSLFPLGGTIRVLESDGKLETVKSDSEASRAIREIELFAPSEIGKWCEVLKFPRSMWHKIPLNTWSGWWQSQILSCVPTRWNGKRQHPHWYQNPQP